MLVGKTVTKKTIEVKFSSPEPNEDSLLLAEEAWNQVSQGEFQENVIKTVNGLKENDWSFISTKICILNATGQTLKKYDEESWHGRFYEGYDPTIENGQGSAIVHVKSNLSLRGSSGCLIYRMENLNRDVFIGWDTPFWGTNKFLVEIQKKDHWWNVANKETMQKLVEDGWSSGVPSDKKYTTDDKKYDFYIEGSVGQERSPLIRVTLYMKKH